MNIIENILEYKDYILESTGIVDIADRFNIELVQSFTGSFTHKAICPFLFHKNGSENTPSFRIDSKNNKYCCFGCSSVGDTANLIQYLSGCPYEEALRKLAIFSGILDGEEFILTLNSGSYIPKVTNTDIYFQCSVALRDHLDAFKNTAVYDLECTWIDAAIEKIDSVFENIDIYDIIKAGEIKNKLCDTLYNRKIYKYV